MDDLTRQQFCAALNISESTVRRLELAGLPFTQVGIRAKRYNLAECKGWLRENQGCLSGQTSKAAAMSASRSMGSAFTDACRKVHLRVMPSP
jgi:hypothetical protein